MDMIALVVASIALGVSGWLFWRTCRIERKVRETAAYSVSVLESVLCERKALESVAADLKRASSQIKAEIGGMKESSERIMDQVATHRLRVMSNYLREVRQHLGFCN